MLRNESRRDLNLMIVKKLRNEKIFPLLLNKLNPEEILV